MSWDLTVKQIVRQAHAEGVSDLLRALLDTADAEPGHECHALEWARRLYADPQNFDRFVRDSQTAREET